MTIESQDNDVYDISQDRDAYLWNVYTLVFQYVVLCGLGHVASMGFSWKLVHTYRKPEPEGKCTKFGSKLIGNTWQKRVSWDLCVNSGLYSAVVAYWYFRACWSVITDFLYNARNGSLLLSSDAESLAARWAQTDYYTVNSISLHVATQIYELLIYILVDKPTVFYAHHLAVMATIIPTLLVGRIQKWFSVFAIAEATNVPLVLYTLMNQVPGMKKTTFYTINGFCLWLSFTLCRLHMGLATAIWVYEVITLLCFSSSDAIETTT